MKKTIFSILLGALSLSAATAQVDFMKNTANKKGSNYKFTIDKQIACSDVKNQGNTGTCWNFSMQSFLESEVIRLGGQPVDLAEMWITRNAYYEKAVKYIRMQGKTNMGQGGEGHDVIDMSKKYGIMPQQVYTGLSAGQKKYNHDEIEAVIKAYCEALVKNLGDGKTLTNNWQAGLNGILDAYFGKAPETFEYQGKVYTPKSFVATTKLNLDDYIEITSFTHHPYYSQFVIEIPDNWSGSPVYNVPLNEMEAIVDNAVKNNYSIEWASDVSEKYFSHKNGLAVVPNKKLEEMSAGERDSLWSNPTKEREITVEMRQEAFDNQTTQDDHGMQIVGLAHDQVGTQYYIIKNSWGGDSNEMGGYFYCSKPYFRYKTTGVMVNKKAIPQDIAKKMGVL